MPRQYNRKLLKRQYPENALFFLNFFHRFDILIPFGRDNYVSANAGSQGGGRLSFLESHHR
jgi:hypothetical protein